MKIRSLVIGGLAVALSVSVAGCTKKTETSPEVLSSQSIETSVTNFLSEYRNCLAKNSNKENGGVNYCVINNTNAASYFRQDVAQTGLVEKGLDPVFCGKGLPDQFAVSSASGVTPTDGYSLVQVTYGSKSETVAFQVKQFGPAVQIIGNSCPE